MKMLVEVSVTAVGENDPKKWPVKIAIAQEAEDGKAFEGTATLLRRLADWFEDKEIMNGPDQSA